MEHVRACTRGIICLVASILICSQAYAGGIGSHAPGMKFSVQDALPQGFWQLQGYPFVIVSSETATETPQVSDSLFFHVADAIRFKVNRSEIVKNDPHFVQKYINGLLPMLESENLRLRMVYVRGAASPEGSFANNKRLAAARTRTIIGLLKDSFNAEKNPIVASTVTEDYEYLIHLMKEAGDPDLAAVKAVYDRHLAALGSDNTVLDAAQREKLEKGCKADLMKLNGGRVWKSMLQKYFPALRSVRIILWFELPDAEVQELAPVELPALPETKANPLCYKYNPLPQLAYGSPAEVKEPVRERQHMLALRTNMLYDVFYMPQYGFAPMWDIEMEYYPRNSHYTFNLQFTNPYWHKWDQHKFFQIRDYRIEVRRYFRDKGDYTGWYASIYGENTKYGIGLSDTKGWQGEGGGGGFQFGYVLPITKKGDLRLEFSAGLGAFFSRYDPYVYGNPITGTQDGSYYYNYLGTAEQFKKRNHTLQWFGPTSLGISLTYDILYRKKK